MNMENEENGKPTPTALLGSNWWRSLQVVY